MDEAAFLVPIVCSLGFFALVGTIWVTSIRASRTRAALSAEIRLRLLEKSAAPSDPQMLQSLAAAESRLMARSHILRSIGWASVLVALGGAFCLLSRIDDSDLLIPGLIFLSAGAGFVVATLLSLWLCRSWGLLREPQKEQA
jgi:hypothetical protein